MEETALQRSQEVEAVTTAYFLEEKISQLKQDEKRLHNSKPQEPSMPQAPRLNQAKIKPLPYPKATVQMDVTEEFLGFVKSLNKIFVIMFMVSWILFGAEGHLLLQVLGGFILLAGLIYFIIKGLSWFLSGRPKLIKQKEEEIKSAIPYQDKCREIDEENRRRQEQLDREVHEKYLADCNNYKLAMAKYEADMKQYHEEVLPPWEEEVAALQTALGEAQAALRELYNRGIIPAQYHNIAALYYLATFLGTSSFDLKYAIERYDTYVLQYQQREQISLAQAQLMVMREVSKNQQYSVWLNEQMVELTEQGNKTLRSISTWQKADMALRAYWRVKDRREAKAGK